MSLQAKFFTALLRLTYLLKARLIPETIKEDTDIFKLRKNNLKTSKKFISPPKHISFKEEKNNICTGYWIKSKNSIKDKIILYFHGGAFVMGSFDSYKNMLGNFVDHLNIDTYIFNYSLSPENKYPKAIEEGIKVYKWLMDLGYSNKDIIFIGDSAGGQVATSTILMLRDMDIPLPGALVLLSPFLDLTMKGVSHKTMRKKDPLTPGGLDVCVKHYIGNINPNDPYVSPVFANLKDFPPTLIHLGTNEILKDDSIKFYEKAKEDGINIQMKISEDMFHCFSLMPPLIPEAKASIKEIREFISTS